MQKRIANAVEEAQEAFWAAIGKAFPEIKTGDFPPDAQAAFDAACESAVETWVTGNSRDIKQDESTDDLTKELLELGFELISTGGGCEAWYLACGQHYVYLTDTDGSTACGLKPTQSLWLGYYAKGPDVGEHCDLLEGDWLTIKAAVLAFKSGEWAKNQT